MIRPHEQTNELVICTIGHSTLSIEEFVERLWENGISMLIDIRTVPRSRTNPQFNKDALTRDLPQFGIKYKHMAALGGLRQARPDSENTVWENASFRGYADYMETDLFRSAVDELIELAAQEHIAIMCAESVWWRCHRGLVSDELVARGIRVDHIIGESRKPHALKAFAHIENDHVSYHEQQNHH